MGFLDILETAVNIGSELLRDQVQHIIDWINEAQARGAARVYLARQKEQGGYLVAARAVNAKDRTLGEESWHIRANTGMKAFMEGSNDGGLGELFEGRKEIYYDFNDEDDEDEDDEDEPVKPSPQGKFCTRCGQKLAAGAKFCGSCGNRV